MRPPYMVNSQLYTFTPVSTMIIAVPTGAGPHGEEMMQPDHEGEDADGHRREHHGAVAEQWLAREGRNDLGEHAERREDQDVNLGMPPHPDEVHEHHGIAAGFVGEEVKAEVTVQEQHGQGRREDGES